MTKADRYRRTMIGIQAALEDLAEEAASNFGTDPEEADWGLFAFIPRNAVIISTSWEKRHINPPACSG